MAPVGDRAAGHGPWAPGWLRQAAPGPAEPQAGPWGGVELMPSQPEVTVIIPTRDRWPLLEVTLHTALAQEDVVLEVLVVDDGSRDETPVRLAEVADERVSVIRHDSSRGVGVARNAAISEARGEWLAFLDDDDLWAPNKLKTQLAATAARGADWAYGAALVVDEEWTVLDRIDVPDPDTLLGLLLVYNRVP